MDSKDLLSFVYICSATTLFDVGMLNSIRMSGATSNRADNITGLLCYNDGGIMHFLEGPKAKVDALVKQQIRNTWHSEFMELYRSPITDRFFHDWSIALPNTSPFPPEQQKTYKTLRSIPSSKVSDAGEYGEDVRALLSSFKSVFRA